MENTIETQIKAIVYARKIIKTLSNLSDSTLPKDYDVDSALNDAANTLQSIIIEDKLNASIKLSKNLV